MFMCRNDETINKLEVGKQYPVSGGFWILMNEVWGPSKEGYIGGKGEVGHPFYEEREVGCSVGSDRLYFQDRVKDN